ncbi:hypothetical protein IEQ34_007646 [Dendrobium chrysotoxum]|uniref:Acyl carrier protein n=1 Tax=Dendrobium chrysotoxum TaxID=161865 RepID=A0AAV7GMN8_DENCH|nr:hypothetical protein IEQ34_007646 [Dendrobium chrysotoxum]
MASVPATPVRLCSALKQTNPSDKVSKRISSMKLFSTGMLRSSLPSLNSSRFQVCCAAKPETVQKVMDIVKQQLALSNETTLTPETQFTALGADSLDTVEIVMGFEEEFGITLEEDNSQNISTVQEAADLIEKLLEKKDAEILGAD